MAAQSGLDAYQHHNWRVTDKFGPLTTGVGRVRGDTPLVAYGICSDNSNSMKSSNPHSGIYEADTARTIDQNGGNPACNQGGIVVCRMVAFGEYATDGTASAMKQRDYKD